MAIKTAASLKEEDVLAMLNTLAAGDEGVLPAGTATWTKPVEWTTPDGVTVRGAGIGQTIIIDDINRSGYDAGLFQTIVPAGTFFRLTGMTFKGSGNSYALTYNGSIRIFGAGEFRVDTVHLQNLSYTGILTGGTLKGVIDHSLFDISGGTALRFFGEGDGDQEWAEDTGLGTDRFIFVEDNVFNAPSGFGGVQDSYKGSRFVVRYNTLNNCALQTHPTGGSGRARGTRAWEIYKNKTAGIDQFNFFFCSSGTGVLWGNDVPTGYKHFITLHAMRRNSGTYQQAPTPDGWGYAGTSFTGKGSNWDGNTDPASGYPNIDQPGRGKGDLLAGAFPAAKNTATGKGAEDPGAWPRQALEPIYEWDNNYVPIQDQNSSKWAVYNPECFQDGRDYKLNTPMPGYVPYAYPHPRVTGVTPPPVDPIPVPVPPDPEPIPPTPPNGAPSVTIKTPTSGQVITVKLFRIEMEVHDDTGVAWTYLSINGTVVAGFPKQGVQTASYTWNTAPYKGKGPVTITATVKDAEGLEASQSVVVTVKK